MYPMNVYKEASFPVTFREEDTKILGNHLKEHNSVVMIGMKRVGINNFLRFFLHHPEVPKTYINGDKPHVFIPIDLNDLVEREISPFWTLVLKRVVDVMERLPIQEKEKKVARRLFSESIQLKDLFFTVDSVQKVLHIIINSEYYPTLFLIRFDRLQNAITQEFFGNLQGLRDATNRQMSYVFTSYRPLYELKPEVFTKSTLTLFSKNMYMKPAKSIDAKIILAMLLERYQLSLPDTVQDTLLTLSGGHVHYLHLSVLKLHEGKVNMENTDQLLEFIMSAEEATLQSEELLESLTKKEQEVALHYGTGENLPERTDETHYLWDSGMITDQKQVFSPLFGGYLKKIAGNKKNGNGPDFTKKENLLFTFLKSHEGDLCEREVIIEAVWPEYAEAGVSDWAIDRLVARVRNKLKGQNSPYEIVTVITRGYKLVKKEM